MNIDQITAAFATFVDWVCLVLMWFVGIVITLQVFNRAFLHVPMPWTEEAARYAFVWLSLMGSIRVARNRGFLKVDLLYIALPKSLKLLCDLFAQAVIFILAFEMVRASAILLPMTLSRYASTMSISMFWMYVATPIAMLLVAIYCTRNIYEAISGKKVKEELVDD